MDLEFMKDNNLMEIQMGLEGSSLEIRIIIRARLLTVLSQATVLILTILQILLTRDIGSTEYYRNQHIQIKEKVRK